MCLRFGLILLLAGLFLLRDVRREVLLKLCWQVLLPTICIRSNVRSHERYKRTATQAQFRLATLMNTIHTAGIDIGLQQSHQLFQIMHCVLISLSIRRPVIFRSGVFIRRRGIFACSCGLLRIRSCLSRFGIGVGIATWIVAMVLRRLRSARRLVYRRVSAVV